MNLIKALNPETHNFYMIDVETDGLSPVHNSMTSICVTQFDPLFGDVIDKLHLCFKRKPIQRVVNDETMNWRKNAKVDEMEKELQSYYTYEALLLIKGFLQNKKEPAILANHIDFDVAFLRGYFVSLGLEIPWKHSNVFDLNSILLGKGIKDRKELRLELTESKRWKDILSLHFEGKELKHDAFFDCVFQIELLMLGLYK